MESAAFILYVSDQQQSTEFYEKTLGIAPSLNVPGMTEFSFSETVKLGLMPESGIAKIIVPKMPHPRIGNGIPRCELYLKVNNPKEYLERGIHMGGKIINAMQSRDWGDTVGYISDLDGNILAFATKTNLPSGRQAVKQKKQ